MNVWICTRCTWTSTNWHVSLFHQTNATTFTFMTFTMFHFCQNDIRELLVQLVISALNCCLDVHVVVCMICMCVSCLLTVQQIHNRWCQMVGQMSNHWELPWWFSVFSWQLWSLLFVLSVSLNSLSKRVDVLTDLSKECLKVCFTD